MSKFSYSWPLILDSGDIVLRPLRRRDRKRWNRVRASNRAWLSEWEATRPVIPGDDTDQELPSFAAMVRSHKEEGRALRSITLAIWYKETLVGQISMGGITFGALRGAHIGYWIDEKFANLGITTRAVSIITKFAFDELFLHRIEINLRPENGPSRRVAEKAGYVLEGARPRYLHIDGAWRDHLSFIRENPNII